MPVSWGSWGGAAEAEVPADIEEKVETTKTPEKKQKKSKKAAAASPKKIKIKTEPGLEEAKVGKVEHVRIKREPGTTHRFESNRASELLPMSTFRRMARRSGVKRISLNFIAPLAYKRTDELIGPILLQGIHHMHYSKRRTLTTRDTNLDNTNIVA